jgi:hypothetical protein
VCVVLLGASTAWGENFRRIIVFQKGTPALVQKAIVVESGSTLLHLLPLVNAVAVKLPPQQTQQALATLQSRPEVVQIHADPAVSAEGLAASEGVEGTLITPMRPAVETPRWNFAQIAFDLGKGEYKRRPVRIAVLDAHGQPCNRQVKFPARYPETIAVAAIDSDRHITDYSIRGAEVDVVAPGGTRLQPVISITTTQRLPVLESPCVVGAGVSPGAAAEGGDCLAAEAEGGDARRRCGRR